MKKNIIFTVLAITGCFCYNTQAQWTNTGTITNAGGLLTDYGGQGNNTATGIYTTAGSTGAPSNFGVFNHMGQSGTGASAAFINDGVYDASVFGIDYFLGPIGSAGQQEISGAVMPIFNQLYIKNGTGSEFNISNTNGIEVTGTIYLGSGIVTTDRTNAVEGAIKMDDDATFATSDPGDAQHVNGYITKKGDDAFAFATGSGTDLRTISMSAPTSISDDYGVAWITGDPSSIPDPTDGGTMHPTNAVMAPITSVSMTGYWDWVAISGTGAGLTVSVSIPDLSATGAAPSSLRLVGWNGSSWVNLSGSTGASGNTEDATLSGTMQEGITAIAIGSIDNVLPVKLSAQFKVDKQGNTAVLSWTTASEQNNKGFGIERSSDGRDWSSIDFVASQATNGNSTGQLVYLYTDNKPLAGTNYYRLKQTDRNGKAVYSKVKSANFSNDLIALYPNPARNQVTLHGLKGNEQIRIYTLTGQMVKTLSATSPNMVIDLSGLSGGTYLVSITDSTGNVVSKKLIIIH